MRGRFAGRIGWGCLVALWLAAACSSDGSPALADAAGDAAAARDAAVDGAGPPADAGGPADGLPHDLAGGPDGAPDDVGGPPRDTVGPPPDAPPPVDVPGRPDGGRPDVAADTGADPGADTGGDTGAPPADRCPPPPDGLPQVFVEDYGRFRVVHGFPGEGLRPRDVFVFLPEGYDDHPEARYPVLYLHDGQNLFDPAQAAFGVEWQVDETVDRLVSAGLVPPLIVVGVGNTADRLAEYRSGPDLTRDDGSPAAHYRRFLAGTLKPWVDAHFRTRCGRAHTALAGSSMGAVASLSHALYYPQVWGRIGCISSAFWYGDSELPVWLAAHTPALLPERVWMDVGTAEGGSASAEAYLYDSRTVRDRLRVLGLVPGHTLACQEEVGAVHNEAAWARRLPTIVRYLFGPAGLLAAPPTSLSLALFDPAPAAGETTTVIVQARLDGDLWHTPPNDTLTLTSDAPAVATIDPDGTVHARAEGTATLRAEDGALAAEARVTVGGGVRVRFEVAVPADTPAGGAVHIVGDRAELGAWDPGAVAMAPRGDGVWTHEIVVPPGTAFAYKYTRGSWATVEKDAAGGELGNRTGRADADQTREDTVARWADR